MIIIFDQSKACKSDETFEHWILSRSISKVIQGHFDWPGFSRPRLTPTNMLAHVIISKMHWDLPQNKKFILKIIKIYSGWCVRKICGGVSSFQTWTCRHSLGQKHKTRPIENSKRFQPETISWDFYEIFSFIYEKNKFIRLSFWVGEIDLRGLGSESFNFYRRHFW